MMVVWLLLALSSLAVLAQQPEAAETGVISGHLRDWQGSPVRMVRIQLQGPRQVLTTTGAAGEFRFAELPEGRYELSQAIQTSWGAVQKVEIVLASREQREGLEVRFQPLGEVTGRVTDEAGDPVADCAAHAFRRTGPGPVHLAPAPLVKTDDRGHYQITGLTEGRYFFTVTCPEVFVRHPYSIDASPAPANGFVFADARYPAGEGLGATVDLPRSGSLDHVDFQVQAVPAARLTLGFEKDSGLVLTGRVTSASGPILSLDDRQIISTELEGGSPDHLNRLLPKGDFDLAAIFTKPSDGQRAGYFYRRVHSDGSTPLKVTISPSPMAALSGSVTCIETNDPCEPTMPVPKTRPEDPPAQENQYLYLRAMIDGPTTPANLVGYRTLLDGKHHFEFPAIVPGRYFVSLESANGSIRSITLGGQTFSGAVVEIPAGPLPPMNISITKRRAQLRMIAAEPPPRDQARCFAVARLDPFLGYADARCEEIGDEKDTSMDLPAGIYRVGMIALDDFDAFYRDPEAGERIELVAGESVTVELKEWRPR